MLYDVTEEGNLLKVTIEGRFVAATAPGLRDDLICKIKEGTNVLFNLGKMTHIDSSGLGVLVQVLQKAKSCGGKVVLAALQAGPKVVFEITKVNRVFDIVPEVSDAKF
ncbi:MAG: STAS domain-containing protein [Victivallales bacterium]|nr:STAS domain-containing protein [Victivallales bacterium]